MVVVAFRGVVVLRGTCAAGSGRRGSGETTCSSGAPAAAAETASEDQERGRPSGDVEAAGESPRRRPRPTASARRCRWRGRSVLREELVERAAEVVPVEARAAGRAGTSRSRAPSAGRRRAAPGRSARPCRRRRGRAHVATSAGGALRLDPHERASTGPEPAPAHVLGERRQVQVALARRGGATKVPLPWIRCSSAVGDEAARWPCARWPARRRRSPSARARRGSRRPGPARGRQRRPARRAAGRAWARRRRRSGPSDVRGSDRRADRYGPARRSPRRSWCQLVRSSQYQ